MPDETLELLVKTTGDTTESDRVNASLEKGAQATKEGGKANEEAKGPLEKLEEHHRELHRLMHKVTEESPVLGLAMKAYFAGPVGAALAALVMAMSAFAKASEEAAKKAEEAGKAAADQCLALKEAENDAAKAAEEAGNKLEQEFDALAQEQAKAKTRTEEVISAINAEKDAVQRLMKVREEYELSQARTEKEKEDIKTRYKDKNYDLEEATAKAVLKEKQEAYNHAILETLALREAMEAAQKRLNAGEGLDQQRSLASRKKTEEEEKERIKKDAEDISKFSTKSPTKAAKAYEDKNFTEQMLEYTQAKIRELESSLAAKKFVADQATKDYQDNWKFINETAREMPRMRLDAARASAEGAYGRGTDAREQFNQVGKHLAEAVGAFDISGIVQATIAMASWPKKLAEMNAAIMEANAEMERSIQNLRKQVRANNP